ncbi:MAG: hypothetical protein AAGP08_05720 [Pseudomonadota bacterium]
MSTNPATWMADNLASFGALKLNQLVMPASHDSAMYEVSDCTTVAGVGANACSTQTQTNDIQGQLTQGSRYFDVRPVMYNSSLVTGHYSSTSSLALGCNGPSLSDYLGQVAAFMQGSGELVILKFSHYFDRDAGSGFSYSDFQALVNSVRATLSDYMYTTPGAPGALSAQTLNAYIGDGTGKVLCVFDSLPADLLDPTRGLFSYADFPGSGDLVVFDEYADQHKLSKMETDQKTKLADTGNHQGNLFLLSWTLTQSDTYAAECAVGIDSHSILNLAATANDALQSTMADWVSDGTITPATIPNLIYVDANASFSLDTALYLNTQLAAMGVAG